MQRQVTATLLAGALLLPLSGCRGTTRVSGSDERSVPIPSTGPRAVVEEYLRAAGQADGARMYALLAGSEREDETPKSLAKTARDRYSAGMTSEVLKSEETGSTASVVVDFKGAKVDPNPYKFTLTREADEWRIVQSPELHERDRDGGIHIKL